MMRFSLHFILSFLGPLSCLIASSTPPPPPPHILLIVTDDQGFSDIGYMDPQFSTPNLDKLASNGIKFNRMYTATTCSPSRSVLLTGKNINRIGVQDGPFVIGEGRALSLNFTLLPQYLQSHGYRTVGIGKWHQGMSTIHEMPLSRGFDEYFGTLNGALDFMSLEIGNQCNSGNPINPDDLPILWGSNCYAINGFDVNDNGRPALEYQHSGKHYTRILGEKAIEKIRSHNPESQPLFLYLAPTAPHSPLEVTGEASSRCHISPPYPPYDMINDTTNRRDLICQLMAGVDDMVGMVIEALVNKNMYHNTLVFYVSDNGGIKLFGSTNNGLRGQKGSYYEGGVRAPFFVSSPLLSPHLRGMVYDGLAHLTDLYATISHAAGVSNDIISESDGLPFLVRLDSNYFGWNPSFERQIVYLGGAGNVMGVGSNQTGYDRPSSAVVYIYNEHIWKYTDFPNSQAFYGEYEDTPDLGSYLFDLTNDPYETTNLFPIVGHIHEPIISRNLSRTDIIWNALQYGLTLIEKMYADGVPSPIDYANPPRMHINLIPNQYGCWIPPDSPYSDIDCGLGNQVHDMSTKEYMPSMMEMVIKRTNKIYST